MMARPIELKQNGLHKKVEMPEHQVTGGVLAVVLRSLAHELEREEHKDQLIEAYGMKKLGKRREFHVIFKEGEK